MDETDKIIEAVNRQKGELMAFQCLVIGIFRALPVPIQAGALREFDTEREVARTVLLNMAVPEALIAGFEHSMTQFDKLRS